MMKAVIFDFGGVIENHYNTFKGISDNFKLFKTNAKKRKELFDYEYKLEQGKISAQKFIKKVSSEFSIDKDKLEDCILGKYFSKVKINQGVIKLVKKLREKYIVSLISNTIEEHATYKKVRGKFKLFNPVILSYKVKLMKPSKEIYLLMLKKLKLKPNECVFIDDYLINVKGARKVGMKSILFKNASQLKRDLVKFGVK